VGFAKLKDSGFIVIFGYLDGKSEIFIYEKRNMDDIDGTDRHF